MWIIYFFKKNRWELLLLFLCLRAIPPDESGWSVTQTARRRVFPIWWRIKERAKRTSAELEWLADVSRPFELRMWTPAGRTSPTHCAAAHAFLISYVKLVILQKQSIREHVCVCVINAWGGKPAEAHMWCLYSTSVFALVKSGMGFGDCKGMGAWRPRSSHREAPGTQINIKCRVFINNWSDAEGWGDLLATRCPTACPDGCKSSQMMRDSAVNQTVIPQIRSLSTLPRPQLNLHFPLFCEVSACCYVPSACLPVEDIIW